MRKMRIWNIISVWGAMALWGCDEGKIYPSVNEGDEGGFRVVLTGKLARATDYGNGYQAVLAVFKAGEDYAEISKRISSGDTVVELANVEVSEGSVELCIVNSIRKRVVSFAALQFEGVKPGETLSFDVGSVDISPYGAIAGQIFSSGCLQCHGGTAHPAAGLDLNREKAYSMLVNVPSAVEEGMLRVKPGDFRKSTLWAAVATTESAGWKFNHSNLLTSEQSGLIEQWIEKGAEK